MLSLYDFTCTRINGQAHPLRQYQGKVLLIVNTASACGFTPQLAALEALHNTYAAQGLVIMGFPCNQFARQDSASNSEIAQFCQYNYGVSFVMMAKIKVYGKNAEPLFRWLTRQAPGVLGTKIIKWNFSKFLIGRDGQTVKRYAPATSPAAMVADIQTLLAKTA